MSVHLLGLWFAHCRSMITFGCWHLSSVLECESIIIIIGVILYMIRMQMECGVHEAVMKKCSEVGMKCSAMESLQS